MLGISDKQGVKRESILVGNFVEQVVSLGKMVDFRVKRNEFRSEEVVGGD